MTRSALVLASLVLTGLALPAAAAPPVPAVPVPDAVPAPAAFTDARQPIEAAGPACKPKDEFGVSYAPWYGPGAYQGCVDLCTSYCADNGGWLVEVHYDHRTPACGCTCCAA